MKIILNKLFLKNFKGIKDLEINFTNETDIFGDNATGKTTIFDSYCWLLWDKDSLNRSDFEIKTIGEDGVIHNLEHSVIGEFVTDNQNLRLQKIYKEKWTKKRGSIQQEFTGHTTDYYINDVPVKKKEYQERIGSLISEEEFKLLSNPSHFNVNIKKEEKRRILMSLIKDISTDDVISSNKALEILRVDLDSYTIEELQAMNKSTSKKINDDIRSLPIRIDELLNSKKDFNFKELEAEKKRISSELEKIDTSLIQTDNSDTLNNINSQMFELEKESESIKRPIDKNNRDLKYKYEEEKEKRERKILNLGKAASEQENALERYKRYVSEYNENIEKYRTSYKEKAIKKYEGQHICSYCKQDLPTEIIEEAENIFNINKSKELEEIMKKANDFKVMIEETNKEIKETEEKITYVMEELSKIELEYNSDKEIELESYPTRCEEIDKKVIALQEQLNSLKPTDNSEILNKKKILQTELEEINSKLAYKEQNKEVDLKISDYEEREKELAKEYEEAQKKLYLCEEFIKSKIDLISGDLNKLFKNVKFKLFETQINGGIVETCEVEVNGVSYSDLNNAAKINSGLDIINVLSGHLDKYTPIFVDNAESVNELMKTNSQIVRLVVSKDKKIKLNNN